jgi:adenosylhomocysteine nucleosidase
MALGSFIRILLHRLAAEHVQQTVADSLRGAAQKHRHDSSPPDAPNGAAGEPTKEQPASAEPAKRDLLPCHVGVVVALPMESGYLEDRLAGLINIHGHGFTIRTGGLAGRGVAVMITGHGQKAARKGALALIEGHCPRWVISAGFAGGLQPQIERGDIVMADSVAGEHGQRLAIDLRMPESEESSSPRVHVGRLLTVDHIIKSADEKRLLGQQHAALAVDMETLAVAQVCRNEKQRFLAIRAITDAVDDELPADVERLLNRPTMARKIGSAAGSLLRRPSAAKDLWKLRESAIVAADRLAKFLDGIIRQLPD